jgi:hypothetical protein
MMSLNISRRDAAQSEGLFRSAFWGGKSEVSTGAAELRPAVLKCQFPENREINREFSKLPTISVRSVRFPVDLRCNPSALRMISCSSLEQGIRLIEQGIHLEQTRDSPIPLGAFGNRIPLAPFLPKTK